MQMQHLKLENGDTLFYLGEKRTLTVIREERKRARVVSALNRLILYVSYEADFEYKRKELEKWYRKEAAVVLAKKAAGYAQQMHVYFKELHIKDQKSRWGSCSSRRSLNFNWRILMAPEPVCDYVLIHELCHLNHMNHSKDFWQMVERYCPEYKQYKLWLKENIRLLYLF